MTWAVSLTTHTFEEQLLSNLQYQLMTITNEMLALTRQSSAVYEEQDTIMKAYIAEHGKDAEGVIDTAAFDYVNSSAFTLPFEKKLSEIQSKEKQMEQEKIQIETRIKEVQTNVESVQKMEQKNSDNLFGYYK